MDFSAISNLNSYTNMLKMQNDWQQKAKNPGGTASKGGGGFGLNIDPERAAEAEKEKKAGSILMKLQSGQDLSAGELEYLREHSPDLYRAAMKLIQEKRAYEEALTRCESKEEVQALHLGKVAEALSTVKDAMERNDVAACIAASGKLDAFSAILLEFTATAEYQEMADTYSELADEKAEAAEELAGDEAPERTAEAEHTAETEETAENQDTEKTGEAKAPEAPEVENEAPAEAKTPAGTGPAGKKKADDYGDKPDWEPQKKARHKPPRPVYNPLPAGAGPAFDAKA